MSPLRTEVEQLIAAGGLGRSETYIRLLRYLAEAAEGGTIPREIDIATDVLGRQDFDSVSDSTARVYMHKLRQKLESYYAGDGEGRESVLVIPKGRYQLALETSDEVAGRKKHRSLMTVAFSVLALAAVAGLGFLAGRSGAPVSAESGGPFQDAPVWSAILDDQRPVTIVVGDYFIFSEADHGRPGERLIRDFSLNSAEDFSRWLQEDPERGERYLDIRLSYLPTGTASALSEVLTVLRPEGRTIRVVPQSRFRPEQLRENHIVYIGYLSGMGQLEQFPFLASRLHIGGSYDVLIDSESARVYESSAGPLTDADVSYGDYGYVSTFPGPSGNQFLYVTGMRDEGLMQMASTLRNPGVVNDLGAGFHSGGAPAFEALFEVSGMDRTYVAAKAQFSAPLDVSKIWMDDSRR